MAASNDIIKIIRQLGDFMSRQDAHNKDQMDGIAAVQLGVTGLEHKLMELHMQSVVSVRELRDEIKDINSKHIATELQLSKTTWAFEVYRAKEEYNRKRKVVLLGNGNFPPDLVQNRITPEMVERVLGFNSARRAAWFSRSKRTLFVEFQSRDTAESARLAEGTTGMAMKPAFPQLYDKARDLYLEHSDRLREKLPAIKADFNLVDPTWGYLPQLIDHANKRIFEVPMYFFATSLEFNRLNMERCIWRSYHTHYR